MALTGCCGHCPVEPYRWLQLLHGRAGDTGDRMTCVWDRSQAPLSRSPYLFAKLLKAEITLDAKLL